VGLGLVFDPIAQHEWQNGDVVVIQTPGEGAYGEENLTSPSSGNEVQVDRRPAGFSHA
jgi:N-methylhydantoinase B/oxoprolinase/acetone carboxylase alpha subunit